MLLGFQRTSLVRDKSEFSVRGSILDIFPNDRSKPIRIDFFDEEIETIFEFDPITPVSYTHLTLPTKA